MPTSHTMPQEKNYKKQEKAVYKRDGKARAKWLEEIVQEKAKQTLHKIGKRYLKKLN